MASFQLLGASAPDLSLPGPWAPRRGAASFGAAPALTWQVDLGGDPAAARAALLAAEAQLLAEEQALERAPARIAAGLRGGGAASFSAGGAAGPERELLGLVAEVQRGEQAPAGAASFGLREVAAEGWLAAQARLQAFMEQVDAAVRNLARVETLVAGRLVARSEVGWGGDTSTLLVAGLSAEDQALHQRALALALRSRLALLRTVAIVARGATIVATMFSSPAGALMALPAAWRFVEQLLEELRGGGAGG